MIFLNGTTDTLELVTSSTADIDYQINWVDVIAATSATPGSSQGKATSATSTTIVSAPSGGTTRQIKSAFIRNRHASVANTVSVKKDVSGTEYLLTPDSILQAGETLTYEDGVGWTQGSTLVSTLTNDVHLGYQDWSVIANPTAPAADTLRIYGRKLAGRVLLKWTPPSGLDTPVQPALFGNSIVFWQPGATSGVINGTVQTAIAAGVATLPTTTNRYTSMRRSVFTSATGINTMNSLRTEAMFFRGATSGMGGFFFFCRFGFTTWTATNRLFVGLCVDTTALLTADPSAKFNTLGFAVDTGATAISFLHNDGSGVGVKEAIAGQPALASSNVYDAYIFCKPNDTTVYFRLDDVTAGTTLIDTSVTGDLPVSTTMLTAVCAIGSGATNAGAGVAAIGLNKMYIESDY